MIPTYVVPNIDTQAASALIVKNLRGITFINFQPEPRLEGQKVEYWVACYYIYICMYDALCTKHKTPVRTIPIPWTPKQNPPPRPLDKPQYIVNYPQITIRNFHN